uniref:H-2 class I histocompatibility antigen, K-K alpha chain-like n=1 Tax=Acanthochromis polyacanthus TaxID=80966 RepID=A0A3Q1HF10_9TELE
MKLKIISQLSHSLKYFYTASSGIPNFPEFASVGMVDNFPIDHYDSNTGRAQIKQDWMTKVIADDPQYMDRNTQVYLGDQQTFKANIEMVKQRFNQTGGVHLYQSMYGCEWDDETDEVNGYDQDGYDGEDFISLDLKTETWTAAKSQAVIMKHIWESNKAYIMSVDLKISSIAAEDWKKYDCVFQMSGVKDDIIKLDKSVIRTNEGKTEMRDDEGGRNTSMKEKLYFSHDERIIVMIELQAFLVNCVWFCLQKQIKPDTVVVAFSVKFVMTDV